MSAPVSTSPKVKQPPYRIYAAIIAAILIARFVNLVTQGAAWVETCQEPPYRHFFFAGTIVLCVLSAFYFRLHLPALTAWLASGLVGCISMLIVDPLAGALLGFAIGGAILLKRSYYHWILRFSLAAIKVSLRTIIVAVVLGGVAGSLAASAWVRYGATDLRRSMQLLSVGLPIAVGSLVAVCLLRLTFRDRNWLGWIGAALLFCSCGLYAGMSRVSTEMRAIRDSIQTVDVHLISLHHIVQSAIDPFATQKQLEIYDAVDRGLALLRMDEALGLGTGVLLDKDSTSADIHRLARLPFIIYLTIRPGCRITDEQFQQLNLKNLATLTCEENTGLTDGAFQNVGFSRMGNLELTGPNFGDGVLQQLRDIPWMATIALNGTRVTTAGLSQIDTTGPLYWLHLRDTQVDDSVFSVLDKHDRLWWVDLTGTQVTGSGLKAFRGSLRELTLTESHFESKYLADLFPPQGEEATPWNSLSLDRLSIAHTRFDEASFDLLSSFSKSLQYLNVAGTGLPVEQLQTLRLPKYGIDASRLTPDNLAGFGAATLVLHYDASLLSPAEIVAHYKLIDQARASILPGYNAGLQVVLENLTLTAEAMEGLREILEDNSIEFTRARTPSGTVKSYPYQSYIYVDYPELQPTLN